MDNNNVFNPNLEATESKAKKFWKIFGTLILSLSLAILTVAVLGI